MCVGDDMGGELVCFLSGVSVDVGCPCVHQCECCC